MREIQIPTPQNTTIPFVMGAIRYGRFKLLNFNDVFPLMPLGTFQLYDLKTDPNETTDLFNAYPNVANYMLTKWQVRDAVRAAL